MIHNRQANSISSYPEEIYGARATGNSSPAGPWKWNLPKQCYISLETKCPSKVRDWKSISRKKENAKSKTVNEGKQKTGTTLPDPKLCVTGVTSMLNSATGTPRSATRGANMAAG